MRGEPQKRAIFDERTDGRQKIFPSPSSSLSLSPTSVVRVRPAEKPTVRPPPTLISFGGCG